MIEIAPLPANGAGNQPSRRQHYQRRYVELLNAAAKQFAEKGYHAATTKDIAQELGVRQGSLYYYIPSKDAALEEICRVAIEGYVRASTRIRLSRKPAAQKVRELIALHLNTLDERPDFFKVFLRHRQDLPAPARRTLGKQVRAYERNVETVFRQGVASGELRPGLDPLLTTMALFGMCNAAAWWWGIRSSATLSDIAAHFAELLLQGLAA